MEKNQQPMREEKCIIAIHHHSSLGYILKPYRALYQPKSRSWKITHNYMDAASLHKEDLHNETLAEKQVIFLAREYRRTSLKSSFGPAAEEKVGPSRHKSGSQQLSPAKEHVLRFVQSKIYSIINIVRAAHIPVLLRESPDIQEPLRAVVKVHKKPARALFHFIKTDKGIDYNMRLLHQDTPVSLIGKRPVLLSRDPCAIVIDKELFVLDNVPANKLMPFFSKPQIHVPQQLQESYFTGFIRKTLQDNPITAEGFTVNTHTHDPEWVLEVTTNLKGRLAIKLQYGYDKHMVLPSDSKKNLVFLSRKNESICYHKYIRNILLEKQAIHTLRNMGLSGNDDVFFTLNDGDHEGTELVSWTNRKHHTLKDAGFRVIRAKDMPTFHLGPVNLESLVEEGSIDWFDIHVTIWLGTKALPFIMLRDTILSGKRTFQLPCGTVFILPARWLTQFKELMYYACPDNRSRKGHFRLRKHHLGLVQGAGLWERSGVPHNFEALYSSRPDRDIKPPQNLKAPLRDYQLQGLAWLRHLHKHQLGGCLADDMGLGKTVQTLALLAESLENPATDTSPRPQNAEGPQQLSLFNSSTEEKPASHQTPAASTHTPSLIIMPTSLIHNWYNEIKKFTPHLKTLIYKENRKTLPGRFHQYQIILTSYGIARNDVDMLKAHAFHYIILDESQFVKNPSSKTYKAITMLSARHRLVLTGTPIENALTDLWAQFNFLNQGMLGNREQFTQRYYRPVEKEGNVHAARELKQLIRPFILRRKKGEVARELPPVTEQVVQCEMTRQQQDAYDRFKSAVRNSLISNLNDSTLGKKQVQILEAILRLRQMSNHPLLANPSYQGDSGKMDEVLYFADSLTAQGHKGIFFSSFVSHLSLIAKELDQREHPYVMLTGSTVNREKVVDKFQKEQGPMLFLISLKAGGTGLNLTAAEYVFILDPWWNPAAEMQAISRAHRIGQEKKVFVYRLIAKNSIEDKIFSLQKRKEELAHSLINDISPFREMTTSEIKELFR